jgi:dolichol-phosphate mannosyltransferase
MSIKLKAVSIVIPAFNEVDNLAILVSEINKSLKKNIFEIIIIDDNSKDGSHIVLANLKKRNHHLKFYIRKKNPDLSQSCQLGFKKSKYNNIIVMDADLQHNPSYLPKMINFFFLKKVDFLIGTRNFTKEFKKNPRFIASFILFKIINFLLGYKTTDPMSGFFIFKKSIYFRNKKELYGLGFKILFDLLYCDKKFLLIENFTIKFRNRKYHQSKMNYRILYILVKMILYFFVKRISKLGYNF